MKTKKIPMLLYVVVLAALSACGGGDSGSPSASPRDTTGTVDARASAPVIVEVPPVIETPPAAIPPAVVSSPVLNPNASLAVNVSAPTYVPASEELAAYLLLNKERSRCGYGLLTQNTQLDAAAKAHADYQIINFLASHFENKTLYPVGFTGVFPTDRVLAQGYMGAADVTDEFSIFNTTDPAQIKTGFGERGIRSLLNAPYHMGGMVSGFRDIGIAVRTKDDAGSGNRGIFVQVDAAYKIADGKQVLGSNDVVTYPCDGSAGVNRQLTGESPNPVPGRDLAKNPLGSSVYVSVREGNTLTITSATMVKASNNGPISLRTPVTSANDPYAPCTTGCFKSHEGYVAADVPLEVNTTYQVSIVGTNNGIAFRRNFSFTTGP